MASREGRGEESFATPLNSPLAGPTFSSDYAHLGARPKVRRQNEEEERRKRLEQEEREKDKEQHAIDTDTDSEEEENECEIDESEQESKAEMQEKESEEAEAKKQEDKDDKEAVTFRQAGKTEKKRRSSKSPLEFLIKRRKFITASPLTAAVSAAALFHTTSSRVAKALTPGRKVKSSKGEKIVSAQKKKRGAASATNLSSKTPTSSPPRTRTGRTSPLLSTVTEEDARSGPSTRASKLASKY